MRARSSTVMLLLGLGCVTGPSSPHPQFLPKTVVAFERMAFFMEELGGNARIRGFDGAVPPGALLQVYDDETGDKVMDIQGDMLGRFDVLMPTQLNHAFTFVGVAGSTTSVGLSFRARIRADALLQSINPRLTGTGSTPNQIVTSVNADATQPGRAFVVMSGDNSVDNVDFHDGNRDLPLVTLPEQQGPQGPIPATPWAATARGNALWVTRYMQGGISALDVNTGAIIGEAGGPPVQELANPIHAVPPVDADGDGNTESDYTRILPRTPTGIAVVGNHAVVAYSNVLTTSPSGFAQFGPGMVASYLLRDDGTPTGEVSVALTNFSNPQHVVAHPDGHSVIVSSAGELQRTDGVWGVATDGGLDVFDAATLTATGTLNLGRIAPSKPLVLPDGVNIYVPSLLQARLVKVDLGTMMLNGPTLVLDPTTELRSVFECALHPTGIAFCGVFDSDKLVAIDARDDKVRPWPFLDDLAFSVVAGNIKLGVQSMAVRAGRNGVDWNGADILVLMSLATRVSAVDTRFVFGP